MYELVLEPGRSEKNYWRDLWRYRELFLILAWRDIAVRYKQTVIGIAWAVLRPLLTTVVFTVLFTKVAKIPAPGSVPYPLLVLAANLPWQFFATAMTDSSNSLIGNTHLISKVYFPRLIVPAGSVLTSFVDFLITLGLMMVLMFWYHFAPDWKLLALPFFMLLAFGVAFGTGLWLCALNVKYRDFRFVVPFIAQFGFFVSPVGYSSTRVVGAWRLLGFSIPARVLYSANPLVGVIDGFRWCLLRGQETIWIPALFMSVGMTMALSLSGFWYFRRVERSFADVI